MSHTLKIWERVLFNWLSELVEAHIDQFTIDEIQALRLITEEMRDLIRE